MTDPKLKNIISQKEEPFVDKKSLIGENAKENISENAKEIEEFCLEDWYHENKDWLYEHRIEIIVGTVVVLAIVGFVVWKIMNARVEEELPEFPCTSITEFQPITTVQQPSSSGNLSMIHRPHTFTPYTRSDFEGVNEDEINWDADEKEFTFHIFSYSISEVNSELLATMLLEPKLQKEFLKPWDQKMFKEMFHGGFLDFDKPLYFFQSDVSENYFKIVFMRNFREFVVSREFAKILGLRTPSEAPPYEFKEAEEIPEDLELKTIDELSESEISLSEETLVSSISEDVDPFKLFDEQVFEPLTEEASVSKVHFRVPEDNPFIEYYTPTTFHEERFAVPWDNFKEEELPGVQEKINRFNEPNRTIIQHQFDTALKRRRKAEGKTVFSDSVEESTVFEEPSEYAFEEEKELLEKFDEELQKETEQNLEQGFTEVVQTDFEKNFKTFENKVRAQVETSLNEEIDLQLKLYEEQREKAFRDQVETQTEEFLDRQYGFRREQRAENFELENDPFQGFEPLRPFEPQQTYEPGNEERPFFEPIPETEEELLKTFRDQIEEFERKLQEDSRGQEKETYKALYKKSESVGETSDSETDFD